MALFDTLSIPSGLEDLFNKILALGNAGTSLQFKPPVVVKTAIKKARLNNRSLFVLWYELYDGFSTGRKTAWTSYWGSLPFGSHTGAGGWPGSGFSAFVYANAPRYKAGLDLLLDPPASTAYDFIVAVTAVEHPLSGFGGYGMIETFPADVADFAGGGSIYLGISSTVATIRITSVSVRVSSPVLGPEQFSNDPALPVSIAPSDGVSWDCSFIEGLTYQTIVEFDVL